MTNKKKKKILFPLSLSLLNCHSMFFKKQNVLEMKKQPFSKILEDSVIKCLKGWKQASIFFLDDHKLFFRINLVCVGVLCIIGSNTVLILTIGLFIGFSEKTFQIKLSTI